MNIPLSYVSRQANYLMQTNGLAHQAFIEIEDSILQNCSDGSGKFTINSSKKNCNGVVPVKEGIYRRLEANYEWFREKPLAYFKNARKGGPIDIYKEFGDRTHPFNVGLEFETGNISSAHRSMNKLCMGIKHNELQMAFLIMPIKHLAYYLTDRVSNYEELAPYYDPTAPLLAKGRDGMSKRNIRKWQNH